MLYIIPDRVYNSNVHSAVSDGSEGVPRSRRIMFLLMVVNSRTTHWFSLQRQPWLPTHPDN
jgi:hypothetical protein